MVAGALMMLAAGVFALVPRALLPGRMDEQLAFRLRNPGHPGQALLVERSDRGGALKTPGQGTETRFASRETPSSRLRLLLPPALFPGRDRESEMEVDIPPLVDPRAVLPGTGLVPGASRCSRRLKMAVIRAVPPDRVKPLVEEAFLAGAAARLGLLRPLKRLGIDPVRVDLDALPIP